MLTRDSALQQHRHRPVIDRFDGHPRTEPPRRHLCSQLLQSCHDGVDKGLGYRTGSRGGPGRSPALAGVCVKRELAHYKDRGAGLVCKAALVSQDPKSVDLAGQRSGGFGPVAVRDADEDQESCPDLSDDLALNAHRRPAHTLHHSPHRTIVADEQFLVTATLKWLHRGVRRSRDDQPALITTAPLASGDEYEQRRKKYAIMMAVRAVCVLLAALTYRFSVPLAILLLVGGAVLPWCAVLIANNRPPKRRRARLGHVSVPPDRALPSGKDEHTVEG